MPLILGIGTEPDRAITQLKNLASDFEISGGISLISSTDGFPPFEFLNRPIIIPSGSGWEALLTPVTNIGDAFVFYVVHALCFDNPPLRS